MRQALKWLFALLVLINVGFWMWARWYKDANTDDAYLPRPPLHADQMVPLNSPGLALRARPPTEPQDSAPLTAVVAPPDPAICFTLGPFESSEQVDKLSSELLKDNKTTVHPRREEEQQPSTYWVYLPAARSRKAAEDTRQELDRLNIGDHLIVTEDGWENAISLGLFTQAENARKRLQELAKKGVKAKQEVRYRVLTRYWLGVQTKLTGEGLDALKSHDWGVPGIGLREHACEPGAGEPKSLPPTK